MMSSSCYIKKLREKVFFFTANAVKVIAYSRNSTWRHADRVTPDFTAYFQISQAYSHVERKERQLKYMYFKTGWINFEATLSLTRIDTSQVTFTFTFTFISHISQVKSNTTYLNNRQPITGSLT